MPRKNRKACVTRVAHISKQFEADEEIRQRLRGGGPLLYPGGCSEDITSCVNNKGYLGPLLSCIVETPKSPPPSIDDLKDELEELLKLCNRGTDIDYDHVGKAAWNLRRLCSFVKSKARRVEVSTVPRLHLLNCIKQYSSIIHLILCHCCSLSLFSLR